MKLPRTSSGVGQVVVDSAINYTANPYFEGVAVGTSTTVVLNKEDTENLITMLQYYKLQVWPDGA